MEEVKRVAGVCKEVEPIRLYEYERVFGAGTTNNEYPTYFKLPIDKIGKIKDQGSIGACVGCVMASFAEVFEKIEAEKDGCNLEDTEVEFSEGWAYGALRDFDANYYGMIVTQALDYWRKTGIVPKKYFNILEEMPKIRQIVDKCPELYEEAENYKIKSYVSFGRFNNEKRDLEIKKAIYNNNYGLFAVSDEYFGGSHAIMIIGWNDETNSYIIKNSWGKYWNGDGTAEVPKEHINAAILLLDEELKLPFKDVEEKKWYYKSVKNVYFGNLMNGISNEEFKPKKEITRAEFIAIMGRLIELANERIKQIVKILKLKKGKTTNIDFSLYEIQKVNKQNLPFADISIDKWYYEDVKKAYEYGLVNGKYIDLDNERKLIFDPNSTITRAEVATLISRICSLILKKINFVIRTEVKIKRELIEVNKEMKFEDVLKQQWYYDNVHTVFNWDIMKGKSEKLFDPQAKITRAESAVIIDRLSKFIDNNNYYVLN